MHHRTGRRLAALLVAALAVAAFIVPSAGASDQLSNKLTVGAVLVNQPKGQAWTIKLHLKADLVDAVDMAELPQSTKYSFKFPKAKLNASKFPVCKAKLADFKLKHEAGCPAKTQVGGGKGNAFGIGISFEDVPIYIFNGAGTDSNRHVIVYSRLKKGGIDVDVFIDGVVKKTSTGFDATFPIPDIQLSESDFAVVSGFDTTIFKVIKSKGKTFSYLEAPTECKDPGFKFSFTAEFKGGKTVTDNKTIPCEIPGV